MQDYWAVDCTMSQNKLAAAADIACEMWRRGVRRYGVSRVLYIHLDDCCIDVEGSPSHHMFEYRDDEGKCFQFAVSTTYLDQDGVMTRREIHSRV